MMRTILTVFLIHLAFHSSAQLYSTLNLPDSLKEGADWVLRSEETILTIKSPEKFTLKSHEVRTLLNEDARDEARFVTPYDRFRNIKDLDATMYNLLGMPVKSTRRSDWQDQSAPDGFSLMTDRRYKYAEFHVTQYPSTVSFDEEVEFEGTQAFPRWMPIYHSRMSLESSKFVIIAPESYQVRYKAFNGAPAPIIEKNNGQVTYTWTMKGMKAVKFEPMQPEWSDILPNVRFAPSAFEVEGFTGNMSTWEGYGKFMYQLIKDKDVLPPATRAKVHELTDELKSDREKVYALYDFMQKNTHYISVQLGIGGWQPFDATYVATKKYGDCKALSNFMIALLKEAGITGKYIEIEAGKDPSTFLHDFPSAQSNHVICCVPLAKDTIWLECTSQTVSPGFMGTFTGNRKAILIEPEGAKIVHTPVYGVNDNQVLRRLDGTVDAAGVLDAQVQTRYRGVEQETVHSLLREISGEERTKYLNGYFDLPTYQVVDNKYNEVRKTIPEMEESLTIKSEGFAVQTGKRLFLKPILLKRSREGFPSDSVRRYDVVIRESSLERDTICIRLPAGYKLESAPKETRIDHALGSYALSYTMDGDKLCCYRETVVKAGTYPAKDFPSLKAFDDRKRSLDKSRFVFVKNE